MSTRSARHPAVGAAAGPGRRAAEGDRARRGTPPTTRCPTSCTPSLVCSTVATGSVDRHRHDRGRTSSGRAAGDHRLQPVVDAALRHPPGVVLRTAGRGRGGRPPWRPPRTARPGGRALHGAEPQLTDIDAPQAIAEARHGNPDYARGDADGALRARRRRLDRDVLASRATTTTRWNRRPPSPAGTATG